VRDRSDAGDWTKRTVRVLRRQAFGQGASLRLIAKPFYARIQGASLRDTLVPAGTIVSAVALLLSASYVPTPSSLPPSLRLSQSGDGIGCGGSNQQPGLPMMTLLPRSAYETSRPLREGRERRVVFGQRPGKQQWVATQQPAGNARLAAAATGCDEAAERRRPASPTLHALPPSLRLSQSGDGIGFGGKLSVRELPCA